MPQGTYSVVVTNPGGQSAELAGAFTVTAPGSRTSSSHLILPSEMGRHISSTIYVEYSNTGSEAMPAPLLVLYAPSWSRPDDHNLPLFTLNPALVVSGYWTSAIPAGYSNTIEILASGTEVPGCSSRANRSRCRSTTPACSSRGTSRRRFQFNLDVYTRTTRQPSTGAACNQAFSRRESRRTAWTAIYSGLTTQIGDTWGDYVKMLDNEAIVPRPAGRGRHGCQRALAVRGHAGRRPVAGAGAGEHNRPRRRRSGAVVPRFQPALSRADQSREALGPLGYGWTDNWQYSLASPPTAPSP